MVMWLLRCVFTFSLPTAVLISVLLVLMCTRQVCVYVCVCVCVCARVYSLSLLHPYN